MLYRALQALSSSVQARDTNTSIVIKPTVIPPTAAPAVQPAPGGGLEALFVKGKVRWSATMRKMKAEVKCARCCTAFGCV